MMKWKIWMMSLFLISLVIAVFGQLKPKMNMEQSGVHRLWETRAVRSSGPGNAIKMASQMRRDQGTESQSFGEGMAAVSVKNKWGYIDKTGKIVIPPQLRIILIVNAESTEV